jgi:hypothetical protein
VLLGNGNGTFQKAITTMTPLAEYGLIALADFTGDGKLDVACGGGDFLLLGNGDGTFQSPLALGAGGTAIAVGDFSSGQADLAVGGVTALLQASLHDTATTLTSSPNPSSFGQRVSFTATVTAHASATPTGTVSFKDGTTLLGTVPLNDGTAQYSTASLNAGSHSITAQYSGDSHFKGSTSAPLRQAVRRTSTTTLLAPSQDPPRFNQSVTFTTTVRSPLGNPRTAELLPL